MGSCVSSSHNTIKTSSNSAAKLSALISEPDTTSPVKNDIINPATINGNSFIDSAPRNSSAWDSTTGNCGLGWFLRDAGKLETEGFSSHRRYVPSALVAEALAVKAAVATAVSSHVNRLTVNSDSKNLVLLLRNQGQDVALRGLLHDIRVLARSLLSISFVYVPRLANTQADSLAKAALASFSSPAIVVD